MKLETKRLVATFSKNFLEVEYVNSLKNPLDVDVNDDNYYAAIQNIYFGLNAQLAISELVERDPKVGHNKEMKVYLTAREFYNEAVAQIKTGFVFDDDLYEMSCLVGLRILLNSIFLILLHVQLSISLLHVLELPLTGNGVNKALLMFRR